MLSAAMVVPWLYLATPVVASAVAIGRTRRLGSIQPYRNFLMSCVAGIAGAIVVLFISIRAFHESVPLAQLPMACYLGIAAACLLRGFNAVLAWVLWRLTPRGADGRVCCAGTEVALSVFRAVVLLAVCVPFVGALAILYRPHGVSPGTPATLLGAQYQDISFAATDGIRLRGWWIPATHTRDTGDENAPLPDADGDRTVILCHGFDADKASQLLMARDLVPNGYNVLAFDFRGHGDSGGQFSTFGDLERRDVLGAVRWLRTHHPEQSRKIFGLGESTGAAALIAAAADPGEDGQAIDAIAVFAPYDRLTALVHDASTDHLTPAAGWVATHLALPLAGAQLGTNLAAFSPADLVQNLAPRPLLVIASEGDDATPIFRSQELYESASQPKYSYWLKKASRQSMLLENRRASLAVRVFFGTARSIL